MIKLGDEARDKVTGVKGVVVGRTVYLNGCVRLMIQPEGVSKDGKTRDTLHVDEPQCKVTKAQKLPAPSITYEQEPRLGEPRSAKHGGGPRPAPEPQSNPERR